MTNGWEHVDEHKCWLFRDSVELIGKRWSASILLQVGRGAERFGEILGAVPGLSDKMLAQRLRELERADLVRRTVVPTTPVQVRYALTERGTDLLRSLQPLVAWGVRWHEADAGTQAGEVSRAS